MGILSEIAMILTNIMVKAIPRGHPLRKTLYNMAPLGLKIMSEHAVMSEQPEIKVSDDFRYDSIFMPLDAYASEVIFAPFHDPEISKDLPIKMDAIVAVNPRVLQDWCWLRVEWEGCEPKKYAASLTLDTDLRLGSYDRTIMCVKLPADVTVAFEARIDGTWISLGAEQSGTGKRMELEFPIAGERMTAVRVFFTPQVSESRSVALYWFALKQGVLTEQMHESRASMPRYDWQGLIKAEWGSVQFERGLLFDASDIEALRQKALLPVWRDHIAILEEKACQCLNRNPQDDLDLFLPINDRNFIRERETGKQPYYVEALGLGFMGLLKDDRAMMRHALEYMMCMLHTRHWTSSAECRVEGSTWDTRCFMEEMTVTCLSLLADWYSFALTNRGKELVRQCLWDKGLSVIERDLMKHGYLWSINQGVMFSRARILGGLMIENAWPHSYGYADRAFVNMEEMLTRYVLPDGGIDEGAGYYSMYTHTTVFGLLAYGRMRNKNIKKLLAKHLLRTEPYMRAMSADAPGSAVIEGDARVNYFGGDMIAVMARFFPESSFSNILGACIKQQSVIAVTGTPSGSGGIVSFIYGPDKIPEPSSTVPLFSLLPDTGHLVHKQTEGKRSLIVHVTGSKANPSHSHLDRGAFTVQADGKWFFVDRGMVPYQQSEAFYLRRTHLHNTITPALKDGTFKDQSPAIKPVTISGKPTGMGMHCVVDLTPVWRGTMINLKRTITVSSVREISICDEGELTGELPLAFHLHSPFEFIHDAEGILVRAQGVVFRVETPWAVETVSREYLMDYRMQTVNHLACISAPVHVFKLLTRIVRLEDDTAEMI